MSQAMTLFDSAQGKLPDHVRELWGDESNTDGGGLRVPSLAFGGKVWKISIDGETRALTRPDPDTGDQVPVGIIRVVVLGFNKSRGRAYYTGTYDPAKPGMPICFSDDGDKPHTKAKEPQSPNCASCQWAAKGSKVAEGRSMVACSTHRMLAVVPVTSKGPTKQPLRMKIPVQSDWDKENVEAQKQRWFAFTQYRDFLKANGINHTAMVVTKMKFDDTPYPKLLFSPEARIDDPAMIRMVQDMMRADSTQGLLNGTWTPNGADAVPVTQLAAPAAAPAPAPKPVAPPVAAAPAPAPKMAVDEAVWDEEPAEVAPKPEPKKRAPRAKPVEAQAVEVVESPAPAPAPKAAAPSNNEDLAALVGEWDE
jgi:hypothetical protein